jgi:hypothetical protein
MDIKSKVSGIMENKVNRRIALGTIAGGLASMVLVLRVLKGRYRVDMPAGAAASGNQKVGIAYRGVKTTIDVPNGISDNKKLQAIISEQIDKDTKLQEAKAIREKEWKNKVIAKRMARIDEWKEQQLKELAESNLGEKDRKAVIEKIEECVARSREDFKQHISSLH